MTWIFDSCRETERKKSAGGDLRCEACSKVHMHCRRVLRCDSGATESLLSFYNWHNLSQLFWPLTVTQDDHFRVREEKESI